MVLRSDDVMSRKGGWATCAVTWNIGKKEMAAVVVVVWMSL